MIDKAPGYHILYTTYKIHTSVCIYIYMYVYTRCTACWIFIFDATSKYRKSQLILVRIRLNFLSQFSCKCVCTVIVATSKAVDPECKLKCSPKHFSTPFFRPCCFHSTLVILCQLCFSPLLQTIYSILIRFNIIFFFFK